MPTNAHAPAGHRHPPVSTFRIQPTKPDQALTVRPNLEGVSLQLSSMSFRLSRDQAIAIADAIVDACEFTG